MVRRSRTLIRCVRQLRKEPTKSIQTSFNLFARSKFAYFILFSLCFLLQQGYSAPPAKTKREGFQLTQEQASAFARLALKGIRKEYPNKPADVLSGRQGRQRAASRCTPPSTAASTGIPPFTATGCWCACCVCSPTCPKSEQIRAVLAEHLTAKNLAGRGRLLHAAEPPVLRADLRLGLAAEAGRGTARLGRCRRQGMVARTCSRWRTRSWPATSPFCRSRPIRSAAASIRTRRSGWRSPSTMPGPWTTSRCASWSRNAAGRYYGKDAEIPGRRGSRTAADFFSPSLMEADLMRRVLPADEFRAWLQTLSARIWPSGEPKTLLDAGDGDRPQRSADRPSGRPEPEPGVVHAQHRRRPAEGRSRPQVLAESAARHAEAALRHVASGDYAGEHWLASFAVYLLSTPAPD